MPTADVDGPQYAWWDISWAIMEPLGWNGLNAWIMMSFVSGAISAQAKEGFGMWEIEASGSELPCAYLHPSAIS